MSPICLFLFGIFLHYDKEVLGLSTENYFDSKVDVEPGEKSCYYHVLEPRRNFLVEITSLDYDENEQIAQIGLSISVNETVKIDKSSVKSYTWDDESLLGGTYKICLNNEYDRRNGKIISIYISYYRHIEDDGEEELELEGSATKNDVKKLFTAVENGIGASLYWSHALRKYEIIDSAFLERMESFVSYWSAIHCIVIMISAVVQVYFVRKLFDSGHTGKKKIWNIVTGQSENWY